MVKVFATVLRFMKNLLFGLIDRVAGSNRLTCHE